MGAIELFFLNNSLTECIRIYQATDEAFERALGIMSGMDETLARLHRIDRRLGRTPVEGMVPLDYTTPGWGLSYERFETFLKILKRSISLDETDEREIRRARQDGRDYISSDLELRPRGRNPLITIPLSEAGPMMDRGNRILVPPDQAEAFMRAVNAARR
jgi:hypothetical protein